MAYSAGPRSRPPPQWGYDEGPANSYPAQERGYGNSFEGYGPSNGRRMNQGGRQKDPGHNAQDQYDGYNMNPWAHESDNHNDPYHDYDGGRADWGQDRRQVRPQAGRSRPPDNRGHHDYHGQDQPHRPLMRDQPSQDSAPGLHDSDRGYGSLNSQGFESNGGRRGPQFNNGGGYGSEPHHADSLPFRDRPQLDLRGQSGNNDQLPRYMNGHAQRFSNDSSGMKGNQGLRDRGQHVQGPAADGGYTWDNSYPSQQMSANQRPYAEQTGSYSSRERTSFEDSGRSFAANPIRPQTAEGFRRNGAPPNLRHPQDEYNSVSNNGTYDRMHEPASSPTLPSDNYGITNAGSIPLASERSRTMTSAIPHSTADSGLIPVEGPGFQEPGAVSGYYGSTGQRQEASRPRGPGRAQTEDPRWKNGNVAQPVQTYEGRVPHLPMESRAEILDASHDDYRPGQGEFHSHRSPLAEDEMPNFDTSPRVADRAQGMTLDDHLAPQQNPPRGQSQAYQNAYEDLPPPSPFRPDEIPRSRSQPDFSGPSRFKGRQGDEYGMTAPRSVPYERPATSASSRDRGPQQYRRPSGHPPRSVGPGGSSHDSPSRGGHGPRDPQGGASRHEGQSQFPRDPRRGPSPRQQNGPAQPPASLPGARGPPLSRRGGPDPRMQQPDRSRAPSNRGDRTRTDLRAGPMRSPPADGPPSQKPTGRHSSLDKPLPNPDALPSHPVPVRPGLNSAPISAPNSRPPPIRQYNGAPSDPVQNQRSNSNSQQRRVTPQEIEHLRQKTIKNPNDSATQFLLAQKLAEAADVLVDDRADPATKKRSRERYQADCLKIIKKLSAVSYAEADFFYADCYSRGALGLQSDIKEAFLLYQKAAKANHAQAAYRVAVCCELGQEEGGGTKRDAVKAMQWYRRAATLGDVAAKYKMGVILLKGLLGQPKNPTEGLTWLKQAAEVADKENPHALHELAILHEKPSGLAGIRQDETYSRSLFIQAANLDYKFSQYRLGCAYEYGTLGCPVDPRQSIAWYSKAAVQEEHQSELALSGWYLTGAEGILQQSDTEAYLWARKAAQAGLAKAEYAMGYYTEVGIGAPANLEDAKRWYWKSASQNFPKARDRLEDLRRGGGPKQKTRVSRTNMRKQSDGECVIM